MVMKLVLGIGGGIEVYESLGSLSGKSELDSKWTCGKSDWKPITSSVLQDLCWVFYCSSPILMIWMTM